MQVHLVLSVATYFSLCACQGDVAPQILEATTYRHYVYKERNNGGKESVPFAVTLECNTKDDSDSVEWYTSGTLTDLNHFTNPDKSLAFPGITEDQSASVAGTDYWCCATNTVGTVCSKNHTLFYASFLIHKWIRAPDTISAFHGYDAVIPCRVPSDAQPPATVEWTVDGTVIDSNDDSDKYTYVPSGDLEIDNVRRDMNGSVYVCRVTNYRVTFSLDSGKSTTLLVRENSEISSAPQFVKQPVDTVAVVNEEVVLECAADSAKSYLWYKDDDTVKQTQLLGTGNFQLAKVTTTDAGSYTCQAVNSKPNPPLFSATQPATLTVHVPPNIKKTVSEHIAYAGAPFELDCEASGKPTPEMKWLDDGVVQSYSRKFSIAKVVKGDEGFYQCYAISSAGVDQHVVKVTVKYPKINSVAISPQLLSIVVGSVGQFNCNSSGDPTPDLEWLFDGDLIIPDDIDINITQKTTPEFLQLSKLTYRVKEKSLGGVHKVTCRAKNHAGSKDSTSSLTVEVGGEIRKQEIQNTFNIVRGKAKSISLPCPSYGYPPVHRIWLKGKVAVDVKQSRINMSATGSLVIGHVDVADEGEYTCNIKNTVGKKTFTDSVKMNLTVTAPSPPQNVTVTALTSSSLHVQWNPPSQSNGALQFYKVYHKPSLSNDNFSVSKNIPIEENSFDITGLLPYTTYDIYVTVINDAKANPENQLSQTVQGRTHTAPPIVPEVPVSANNDGQFTAPPISNSSGPISFIYIIVYHGPLDVCSPSNTDIPKSIGAYSDSSNWYVAAKYTYKEYESNIAGKSFVIGDGQTTAVNGEEFTNVEVTPGYRYSIYILITSAGDSEDYGVSTAPIQYAVALSAPSDFDSVDVIIAAVVPTVILLFVNALLVIKLTRCTHKLDELVSTTNPAKMETKDMHDSSAYGLTGSIHYGHQCRAAVVQSAESNEETYEEVSPSTKYYSERQ